MRQPKIDVVTQGNTDKAMSLDMAQCFAFVFALAHNPSDCEKAVFAAKVAHGKIVDNDEMFTLSKTMKQIEAAGLDIVRKGIAQRVGGSCGSVAEEILRSL